VAGGAGQWEALAEPVHPVEAGGGVGLRHGAEVLGRGEGDPAGLVGEGRLSRAESGRPGGSRLKDSQELEEGGQLFFRWKQRKKEIWRSYFPQESITS